MSLRRTFVSGTVAISLVVCALAEPAIDSLSITNWGKPIAGVQLSASLATNVVEIGSSAIAQVRLKNSSTNEIFIFHNGALPHDFGIVLVDEAGKRIDLTPKMQHPIVSWGSLHLGIKPGTTRDSEVRMILDAGLSPGIYQLEFCRYFDIPGGSNDNRLVSNPLTVEIVRPKP